jgi:tetratricopeptide (TPR) repeat protein
MANVVVSYVTYIGQMFWPVRLALVYPFPQWGWTSLQVFFSVVVLVIISLICLGGRRKYPFLLTGWLWFLVMLVPMIGLIQVGPQARADRYTYLSQIGLYIVVVWSALEISTKWKPARMLLIASAILIGSALMAGSWIQTSHWRDSESIWTQTIANASPNYVGETQLGDALTKLGRLDEAVVHLRRALELNDYHIAHQNLGVALTKKGEWADALASFEAAIRLRPSYSQAQLNVGVCLSKLGRSEEALVAFQRALRLDPDLREAHVNLAILLLYLDRRDEAKVHFRQALRLKRDDPAIMEQLRQLETGR